MQNTKLKSIICSALTGILISSYSLPVFGTNNKLLNEDFEGSLTNWNITKENWSIKETSSNNVLYHNSNSEGRIEAGNTTWRNYTISADIKIDTFFGSDRGALLAGRYTNGNNYYSVSLSNKNNGTIYLKKKVNGSSTTLATIKTPLSTDTWYNVSLEFEDTLINVYLDNKLILTATDSSFSNGKIALISNKSECNFDNVLVSTNTITTTPNIPNTDDEASDIPENTEPVNPEVPENSIVPETPESNPSIPEDNNTDSSDDLIDSTVSRSAFGYGENAIGGANTVVPVFEVYTRDQLKTALSQKVLDPETGKVSSTAPRTIVLMADINLCVDSKGNEFIPGVSSTNDMIWQSGSDMLKDVVLKVNSNTTILGKYDHETGSGRTLSGGGLKVSGSDNVVIKYINFADAYDFFPEWDGSEWNTEIDNLVLDNATNVWIDHCTFSDGDNIETATDCKDPNNPIHHDGLLDIKKGSDYITISNSTFENHKKAILIGHSDSASSTDAGKLHITFANNYFNNIKERMPRLRYGNIHSYNNYYTCDSSHSIGYIYGMGIRSTVYSEDNIFDIKSANIYKAMNSGTATYFYEEKGSILNGSLIEANTYGASTPAYSETAAPTYDYTSIKITEDNYKAVKDYIINNAGHTN